MDAGVLAQVLRALPLTVNPDVLVDQTTADDAAVYRLTPEMALVLTVDFFTPVVDDPDDFGAIAAANALSDVYAMGAKPLAALAIAAFPEAGLSTSILTAIFAAGAAKAAEAGIAVIGGHTVKDPQPKYGLSVVGTAHPESLVRNSTAKAGDALVLTKPLGTGILTTARRRDAIDDAKLREAIESMKTLNREASEVMLAFGAHAATDITGFGLLGHAREMSEGSAAGIEIDSDKVPVFAGALELAGEHAPSGTRANLSRAEECGTVFEPPVSAARRLVLADAQTSGGLLIAIEASRADALLEELARRGVNRAAAVGRIVSERVFRVR